MRKANKKCHMYVDYSNISRACPKNLYLLSNIDKLLENSYGIKLSSYLDADYGYNQILMGLLTV